ncbi:MATE efflux family protein [Candidatus Halobonum tyrrellensis G22]|uniref:Multidrug-efflux transporter n=2 Tax=Candidatus Halobonum TaxID=1431544 RepID=V4HIC8_9EURY|nr:MATE efflux family protein [Candidatus Halobonum tyrrellensis G22]
MRTTDVIVTAQFSPAAVVAIGLADLYARFPLRIGLGLGGGAIALSSQDTGAAAAANRDEAVTQALVMGALLGLPFVAVGALFGRDLIALLGAAPETARLGGTYLAVVFATAPARHVALIGARSLQGTGDTRTPMYVNVVANGLNIAGSVALGLGVGPFPRLDVVGVGLATAGANVFTALLLVLAFATSWAGATLVRPRDPVVARQLVRVSAPRVLEGFSAAVAEFPFNSLLLAFGTPVNAGFQIGRRMYQQVTGPLSRGYNVAASVLVGQSLGDGDPDRARYQGYAVVALGLLTVGAVGAALVALAPAFVRVFDVAAPAVPYGVAFARVYGVTAPFLIAFSVLSGALQGASETRIPLVARLTGTFGFLLGLSYLLGDTLGYGPVGAYWGVGLQFVWMALVVAAGFRYSGWASRAAAMMAERGSGSEENEDPQVEETG